MKRALAGWDGWMRYVVALACLAPIVAPSGPARTAIVDPLIALGLAVFTVLVLTRRQTLRLPFLPAVFVISVSSLIAAINAKQPGMSALTMFQDAYLYAFLVMLANVMLTRDTARLRIAWTWVAIAIAIFGFVTLFAERHVTPFDIIRPKGPRAYASFYDPNMFASYLVMSLFMVLSLGGIIGRRLRWSALLILGAALLATKSNGGMLSWVVGFGVWAAVRAWTRRVSPLALAGGGLMAITTVLAAVWMISGFGWGASELETLTANSFLGRAEHSSETRFKIWQRLENSYLTAPLGIGPGNSSWQTLTVADAERPKGSMQSKEAHNDYLAYAIERGPLALLALLVLLGQGFGKVRTWWRRRVREGDVADSDGALAASLMGALAAASVHALTIEVLHFRHFWMLMAIICALDGTASRRAEPAPAVKEPARPSPGRVAVAGT